LLHKWRAHKGVDFGAPSGTRVLATGEGTVAFRGVRHGYGNVVELRHRGGYTTVYGHLSRFAEGLQVGDAVDQGDVIGFVGMTGLATGPHLHYEFRVAGVCRDPQGTELPVALPADPHFQARFARTAAPLVAGLDIARSTGGTTPRFE
jgi:murein DD-endopeptidase MepM/ murein hydrolase activator NlpD